MSNKKSVTTFHYLLIILAGLIVHLIAAATNSGFPTDMNCFASWSSTVYRGGFSSFYGTTGFIDYPPGYLYFLYIIGFFRETLGINSGFASELVIKFPAIAANILSGVFIYKIAAKRLTNKHALVCAFLYMFNPAIVFVSAMWGQIDAIYALLCIISVYFLIEKKILPASLIFIASVLIKMQTLMFAPIYLYAFFRFVTEDKKMENANIKTTTKISAITGSSIAAVGILLSTLALINITKAIQTAAPTEKPVIVYTPGFWLIVGATLIIIGVALLTSAIVLSKNKNAKLSLISINFTRLLMYAGICLSELLVLTLPFATYSSSGISYKILMEKVLTATETYPKISVNAYNFYTMIGKNWGDLSDTVFKFGNSAFTYKMLGMIVMVLIVAFALFLLFRNRSESNYFFTGAMITMCMFTFATQMHERYCFPVLAFLLCAYIYKCDRKILYIFGIYSVLMFFHFEDILNLYKNVGEDGSPIWNRIDGTKIIWSFYFVAAFVIMTVMTFLIYHGNKKIENKKKKQEAIVQIQTTEPTNNKWHKNELIFLAAITVLYAILAFTKLGNTKAPTTTWVATRGSECIVDFGEPRKVTRMQYMTNSYTSTYATDSSNCTLSFSIDGKTYTNSLDLNDFSTFTLSEKNVNLEIQYVKIFVNSTNFRFNEIVFHDENDEIIPIANVSGYEGCELLFDEQDLVPDVNNYMNSIYFDETHHVRTGYEFIHGLRVYEWTHPPFGKFLMSLGIRMFGMTPFGWRFMGVFFSVLMVPAMYLLSRKVLKKGIWAALATILFTFDFMHIVQARIATIDTYVVFFIILSYYFMASYLSTDFKDPTRRFWKSLVPLGLSGVCMGLSISSKLPGVYAGLGLGILFFLNLGKRFHEYLQARKHPTKENSYLRVSFIGNTIKTLLFCILAFIIVPAGIILLTYVPWYYFSKTLQYGQTIESMNFFSKYPNMLKFFPKDATSGFRHFVGAVLSNFESFLGYHTNLKSSSPHSYASDWRMWINNVRPMFFYSKTIAPNIKQGIATFNNPSVNNVGFFAMFFAAYIAVSNIISAFINKTKSIDLGRVFKAMAVPTFIVIGYLAQLLPWLAVPRETYAYHYYPSVPFLALGIAYMFKTFRRGNKTADEWRERAAIIFAAICIALFIIFFPVLTGISLHTSYGETLKWYLFPRWVLY